MTTQTKWWVGILGLVEAITWLNSTKAPPTFQSRSQPIHGIFFMPQLLAMASGGYFGSADAIPSDHRALWLALNLPVCPQ